MTSPSINPDQLLPLSEKEMEELDSFLMSDATSDETMSLDTLDGYLTAIVVGPTTLDFSQWFSSIWGPKKEDTPNFKSIAEAQRIIDLIIRQMTRIISDLENYPDDILPIFNTVVYPDTTYEYTDGEMWAYGFMCGINLCRKNWQPLFDDPNSAKVLRPIHLLGSDDVTSKERALIRTPEQREKLALKIPNSVAWIYRFWLPYRHAIYERTVATIIQEDQTKIGRNDLCPCGSGLKFKKCCGTATLLH